MNIGLLYPSSKAYPKLGFQFMEGLKTNLSFAGISDQLVIISESIGNGGLEKEVYQKAEKLLMIDGVDVLLAFVDEKVLLTLNPLLQASGKLVVIIHPGANYPLNWVPQSNVVHLTLLHGFLCRLAGMLAAEGANPNAVYSSTYYDCGYLHGAAMVKGFTQNGGAITFNFINNDLYDETFNIQALTTFLQTNPATKKLLCVFDTLPAKLLFQQFQQVESPGQLDLFASPMMFEEDAIAALTDVKHFSLQGYIPWDKSSNLESNQQFIAACTDKKKEATIFSLLGWEAGIILGQVFTHFQAGNSEGDEIVDQLKGLSLNSPRGLMKLNPETHHFIAPIVKCSIDKGPGELIKETVADFSGQWKVFSAEPTLGVVSGWLNTYLCY